MNKGFVGIELTQKESELLTSASEKTFQSKRQFVKQAVIERIRTVEGVEE